MCSTCQRSCQTYDVTDCTEYKPAEPCIWYEPKRLWCSRKDHFVTEGCYCEEYENCDSVILSM